MPKFIKNLDELELIRVYLKSIYKHLRETYKFYAGIAPCSNIPCISQNVFLDVSNQTSLLDSKDMKLSDLDLEFTATKASLKKMELNPDKWWLVRYQFMEIFVRIALKKYFNKENKESKDGSKYTESQAVRKLFEDHLLPNFTKHNAHKWRETYCWCQEVDEAFQDHLDEIKALFQKYSGKYSHPGKARFVSLDEFFSMINNSGIMESKSIGLGDVGSIFNVSMMTQVKELEYERHMEM